MQSSASSSPVEQEAIGAKPLAQASLAKNNQAFTAENNSRLSKK
jgi:hypothetical protein